MKDRPEKKSLLQRWKDRDKTAAKISNGGIEKVAQKAGAPLSHGQERLWFLEQLYPKNPVYNYSELFHFEGDLHSTSLKKSISKVFDDHDILKTSFQEKNGGVVQKIDESASLKILEKDLSSLASSEREHNKDQILLENARKPFDLESAPLMRVILLKMKESSYVLFITMHHIITDKWSMEVFRRQLVNQYKALRGEKGTVAKKTDLQFTDYAVWQRKQTINESDLNYWKAKLGGDLPSLDLPLDFIPPKTPSFSGAYIEDRFDTKLSLGLISLAQRYQTTPYVLLLSLFYTLLFRYSRQRDILIGSPIANRDEKGLDELIGFFDETIVLRTKIAPEMTFEDLVQRVKENVLEAFSHKNVPYDILVKEISPERSLSTNPFFRTMFIYHQVPESPDLGDDLELRFLSFDSQVAKFDLTLYISNDQGLLSPTFEYATDLFNAATIRQLHTHFKALCRAVVEDTKYSIAEIPMLSEGEKVVISDKNPSGKRPFQGFNGIHEIIEEAARKNPNSIALVYKNESISYTDLNSKAARWAKLIAKETNGRNEVVALCADRSIDLIIGVLAILKSGNAYLPLDPDYPKERLAFMLEDSSTKVILLQQAHSDIFNAYQGRKIFIDRTASLPQVEGVSLPKVRAEDLAYLIYTSGSTGKPKGVPIRHRNIIASTEGRLTFYPENPKVFLLLSSIAFDSSKAGLYWTLCTGGKLVLSERRLEQDLDKLVATIYEQEVSHTLLLPTLYHLILEHSNPKDLESLKAVIVAGEACPKALPKQHYLKLPKVALYNEYGPTEATVWCTAHQFSKDENSFTVAIGKPVANAQIYLLDEQLRPVPRGAAGNLYVGGPGLSGAYLKRPELTDKAFINNPFDPTTNSRLYNTGDLGRLNSEGNIEFLGRADQQIKLRGHRIELSEIEKQLLAHYSVESAVVFAAMEDAEEEEQTTSVNKIHAAVTLRESSNEAELKISLKEILPEYMIPSKIFVLEKIPLLPNGKIDRKSLPSSAYQTNQPAAQIQPTSNVQRQLVAIWEEVLNVRPIGITDNFFAIGGDSISSIQIIAKARSYGLELKPSQLFDSQTIEELALFVQAKAADEDSMRAFVSGIVPLTPIQKWFFETHRTAPHFWNNIVEIEGLKTGPQAVEKVVRALVYHHEALRLSFHKKENSLIAEVLQPSKTEDLFVYYELKNLKEASEQNNRISNELESIQNSCDLRKGGLFKAVYFNCGEVQKDKVFIIAHHLVVDVVSWNMIFSDFRSALEQLENKKDILFKPKTASIRSWGDYLMKSSQSKEFLEELTYWSTQKIENALELPRDSKITSEDFKEHSTANVQISINVQKTSQLLREANEAYNTTAEDLLLGALYSTLTSWTGDDRFLIGLESHGRLIKTGVPEVSDTVGWFTSFYPIVLHVPDGKDPENTIKTIKEKLRTVPNEGIGYGILRYLSTDPKTQSLDQKPDLIFNYLGVREKTSKKSDIVFKPLWTGARHPQSERPYSIEINAYVDNKTLLVNWSYAKEIYKQETIQSLSEDFKNHLSQLLQHCIGRDSDSYTPSDFPEADLSQEDLDELMKRLNP